jgi:peptide/nickel transport system substrate-binding protein
MRSIRILLVLVLILGLFTGLAFTGAEKRVLRVTFAWPTYIDPAVGSDYSSSSSLVNLYDTLVYPNPAGEMEPHVAGRWEVSLDGLAYTFYLREGVKFHDGTELNAEDVVFSMERLLTIGEGFAYLFIGKVKAVEAVDKYTVRFHMVEPFGPFISSLVRFYILSKDCVMANLKLPGPYGDYGDYAKEYLLTNDCGSGPYKVKEFPLAEYLLMEKFEDYWGEFAPNAPDEVKFIGTTEPVTVRTMMARRELEITDQWQPEEAFQALDEIEGVDRVGWFDGGMHYLMLHNRKPPTDDVHFRRALSWVMNYKTVTEKIFPGTRQSIGPVAHVLPGHNPHVLQYHQDFDKALEELKKSKYYGMLDQYPVEYHWTAEVPDLEKIALMFMADAAKVGIEVKVVKTPWLKMIDQAASIETTPNIMSIWVAPHYPEAGSQLETKYHSENVGTWEQTEWLMDPEIDRLIDEALATIDKEERFKKYWELQEKIVELAPSIFVFDAYEKHAYQSYYVDWPQAREPIPVMGYNFAARFIQVYPEKK